MLRFRPLHCIFLIIPLFFLTYLFFPVKLLQKREIKHATVSNLNHSPVNSVGKHAFDALGSDKIALIMMVKDEEDIILENLMWHFCLGFRKFIIIDNNSSDKTSALLHHFKHITLKKASVFIIEDPIEEYIQSQITTAGYHFARTIWPHVEWIFPVDADEFWFPSCPMKDILNSIDPKIEAILAQAVNYRPTEEYKKKDASRLFYENLTHHEKSYNKNYFPKVAVKSLPNIIIEQGNHSAHYVAYKKLLSYKGGSDVGIDIRTYPIRSVKQAKSKFSNGMKAILMAREKKLIGKDTGTHWATFYDEIQKKNIEKASEDRFYETIEDQNNVTHDPIDFKIVIEFFENIIKEDDT